MQRFVRSVRQRCRQQSYNPGGSEERVGFGFTADWRQALRGRRRETCLMLNESMFLFPCPGCGSALHIEMSGLEHTAPATVSCRLCRIPVSVPRFGNRVLISAGDLFQVFRAVDRQSGQVIALKSISRSRLRDRVIQKREDRASSKPRPPDGAWGVATLRKERRPAPALGM